MATGTSVNMETEFWVVERKEKGKKASNRSYPRKGEGEGRSPWGRGFGGGGIQGTICIFPEYARVIFNERNDPL